MKGSILLVEDEKNIAELVCRMLVQAGYEVEHVDNADSAFACIKHGETDLVLLDIGLPGISGLKLLEILKHEKITAGIPVIMLTVLGDESDKVAGLTKGADDYLVKPFSSKELLARMGAVLRRVRYSGRVSSVLEAGEICLDNEKHEVTVKGRRISVTPSEMELLAIFMKRKGFVLTYDTLTEHLAKGCKDITSGTIQAHVKNLRKKLGPAGKIIKTVHGVGYQL